MPAYVFAEMSVTDPEIYERFKPIAAASIAAHGGTYKVRGGAVESLEGDPVTGRVVVLELPSLQAAQNWYRSDKYRAALQLREAAARSRVFIVDRTQLPG